MTNKVLITGANKGIGLETARQLGQKGWYILLGARNEERGLAAIEVLKSEGINNVEFIKIDLNDLETIRTARSYIDQNHSDINAVINNAGIPGDMSKRPLDFSVEELKEVIDVNFFGNFEMIKNFTPILATNNGKILNLTIPEKPSSFFFPFAYITSKSTLNSMIRLFAKDFKKNKIQVQIYGIIPGGVTTDLNGNVSGRMMHTLEEGGKIVSSALMSSKNNQGKLIVKMDFMKLLFRGTFKKH